MIDIDSKVSGLLFELEKWFREMNWRLMTARSVAIKWLTSAKHLECICFVLQVLHHLQWKLNDSWPFCVWGQKLCLNCSFVFISLFLYLFIHCSIHIPFVTNTPFGTLLCLQNCCFRHLLIMITLVSSLTSVVFATAVYMSVITGTKGSCHFYQRAVHMLWTLQC